MSYIKTNKPMALIWVLLATTQASAFVMVPRFSTQFGAGLRFIIGNKAKVGGKVWNAKAAEQWNTDLKSVLAVWSRAGEITSQIEGTRANGGPQEPQPNGALKAIANGEASSSGSGPQDGAPEAESDSTPGIIQTVTKALKALSPAPDGSESDRDLTTVSGKILDLSISFSGLIPVSDLISIGAFVKASWTNSEQKMGDSCKLSSSVSGAVGFALGITRFIEARFGLGAGKYTLDFDPSADLKNNMDSVKNLAKSLKDKVGSQDLGDQSARFKDLTNVPEDYTKARSADAVVMQFIAEFLVKLPLSDNLDFIITAGLTNPLGKGTFTKVGQDNTDVTVTPPMSMNLGAGLAYSV